MIFLINGDLRFIFNGSLLFLDESSFDWGVSNHFSFFPDVRYSLLSIAILLENLSAS